MSPLYLTFFDPSLIVLFIVAKSLFPNQPGAHLTPGRGCVACLSLIGQYNLHEPLRPITGLKIQQDTEDREERKDREERREREN